MPSRVKTTEQARGLQRCSTHDCRCCDRQGRTFSDHTAYVERWHLIGDSDRPSFGWRAHGFDGPVMLRDERVIEDRYASVCAKHKNATGVFYKWLPAFGAQDESTQMIRVVMA